MDKGKKASIGKDAVLSSGEKGTVKTARPRGSTAKLRSTPTTKTEAHTDFRSINKSEQSRFRAWMSSSDSPQFGSATADNEATVHRASVIQVTDHASRKLWYLSQAGNSSVTNLQ